MPTATLILAARTHVWAHAQHAAQIIRVQTIGHAGHLDTPAARKRAWQLRAQDSHAVDDAQ
jgi:hypothetical protein